MGGLRITIGAPLPGLRGLDFPGVSASNDGADTIKFGWKPSWNSAVGPISPYPATVMYKGFPRDYGASNSKYWTAFFYGNNGTFTWSSGAGKCYYGAHPFPDAPEGTDTWWEIACDGADDTNGFTTDVVYAQWNSCVFRCQQNGANWEHQFYYDYARAGLTTAIEFTSTDAGYGSTLPPNPSFFWGDCPWPFNAGPPKTGEGHEIWNGYLRGFQIYNYRLSDSQIAAVANLETDAAVLSACSANGMAVPWYLNMNPTPSDIADKSGNGNHPAWYNTNRPTLWAG
jgi:hypothetical protein